MPPDKKTLAFFANIMQHHLMLQGKLLHACANTLPKMSLPADRDQAIRFAFYAGAETVLSSIMNGLDSGREPTSNDLEKVSRLYAEILKWQESAPMQINTNSTVTTKGSDNVGSN